MFMVFKMFRTTKIANIIFVLTFAADIPYPGVHIQRDPNPELPQTVTALTTENGSKIYIVGTAHFSESSQDDVSKVQHSHSGYKIYIL